MNKIARIYCRVSTKEQNLQRQEDLVEYAKSQGYYVAKVYNEKASGAIINRPILNELIEDLQNGEILIAEHIDRISRLPLDEAQKLIERIKAKGVKLVIPNVVNLQDIVPEDNMSRIVMDSIQEMLLKLALQMAREDYETRRKRQAQGIAKAKLKGQYKGRQPNWQQHEKILDLRAKGFSIKQTAQICACSEIQVKKISAKYKEHSSVLSSRK